MTPKADATLGPEDSLDELDQRHALGKQGEPAMVPPEDRQTPREVPIHVVTEARVVELVHQQMGDELKPLRQIIKNLHDVLVGPCDGEGVPVKGEDGMPIGGIGKELHRTNGHLGVIRGNTDGFADTQDGRPFSERVAHAIGGRVVDVFERIIKAEFEKLHEADAALLARIEQLEEASHQGPNGSSHPPKA